MTSTNGYQPRADKFSFGSGWSVTRGAMLFIHRGLIGIHGKSFPGQDEIGDYSGLG